MSETSIKLNKRKPEEEKKGKGKKKMNPVINNLRQIIRVAWQMLMEGFALGQALF